jgi:nucleoid DNA-binding protein
VKIFLNETLNLIRELLINDTIEEVSFRGFGTFRKRTVNFNIKAKYGENKGRTITVSFRPGKELKRRL